MAFNLGSFLIQFLIIVGGAALFRRLLRAVGQPGIVGELLLGVLLGPSLLAWAWPGGYSVFFPAENRPLLEALANIGLLIFVYQVGAELRWSKSEAWPIVFTAMGGLVVPFVVGSVLALSSPSWFFPGNPTFNAMVLVGVVMAVSAIPILGRILGDLHLLQSRLATLTLGAATIDDVVGWTLLGIVAGTGTVGLLGNLNLNLLLIAVLCGLAFVSERLLRPVFARQDSSHNPQFFVWLLLAIFASAFITHAAGLHAVLGPFIVGALVSRHEGIRDYARTRVDEVNMILFLPAFFVLAGMDINLRLLPFPAGIVALAVIVLVATVGKVAGAYIGARALNVEPRLAFQAGVLLSTRGAVGLVVAKVGFQAGFFSASGYTLLALMIGITTVLTPIVLGALRRAPADPPAAAPA